MFICITNLYNYTCTMHMYFKLDSVNSNVYLHYKHQKIQRKNQWYNCMPKCSFHQQLKKNTNTWLWKTPQKVAPISPVSEPIDTTFYMVLRGNIWLHKALEPKRWIYGLFHSLFHSLEQGFKLYVNTSENHVYSISKAFT